jgi:DNA-binding FadR family transcriptional regulator
VIGLLEAYWDAYEAVELNTYADYAYLQKVWDYHDRMVAAIVAGEHAQGKVLLIEHMKLLSSRGISMESSANPMALGVST